MAGSTSAGLISARAVLGALASPELADAQGSELGPTLNFSLVLLSFSPYMVAALCRQPAVCTSFNIATRLHL